MTRSGPPDFDAGDGRGDRGGDNGQSTVTAGFAGGPDPERVVRVRAVVRPNDDTPDGTPSVSVVVAGYLVASGLVLTAEAVTRFGSAVSLSVEFGVVEAVGAAGVGAAGAVAAGGVRAETAPSPTWAGPSSTQLGTDAAVARRQLDVALDAAEDYASQVQAAADDFATVVAELCDAYFRRWEDETATLARKVRTRVRELVSDGPSAPADDPEVRSMDQRIREEQFAIGSSLAASEHECGEISLVPVTETDLVVRGFRDELRASRRMAPRAPSPDRPELGDATGAGAAEPRYEGLVRRIAVSAAELRARVSEVADDTSDRVDSRIKESAPSRRLIDLVHTVADDVDTHLLNSADGAESGSPPRRFPTVTRVAAVRELTRTAADEDRRIRDGLITARRALDAALATADREFAVTVPLVLRGEDPSGGSAGAGVELLSRRRADGRPELPRGGAEPPRPEPSSGDVGQLPVAAGIRWADERSGLALLELLEPGPDRHGEDPPFVTLPPQRVGRAFYGIARSSHLRVEGKVTAVPGQDGSANGRPGAAAPPRLLLAVEASYDAPGADVGPDGADGARARDSGRGTDSDSDWASLRGAPVFVNGGYAGTVVDAWGSDLSPGTGSGRPRRQLLVSPPSAALAVLRRLSRERRAARHGDEPGAGAENDEAFRTLLDDPDDVPEIRSVVLTEHTEVVRTGEVVRVEPAFRLLPDDDSSRSSPGLLLDSAHEVVSFTGRDDELRQLVVWCREGPGAIAARLVTGPGGSGKSRLAAELCRRLENAGWSAGFASLGEPSPGPGAGFRPAGDPGSTTPPALIVVDDVDLNAEQAGQLLRRLTLDRSGNRTRLLLLARHRKSWWWRRFATSSGSAADRLPGLDNSKDLVLGEIPLASDARRQLAGDAHVAYGEVLPSPRASSTDGVASDVLTHVLSSGDLGLPLVLQARMLLERHPEARKLPPDAGRDLVLRELLMVERLHWRRSLRDHVADGRPSGRFPRTDDLHEGTTTHDGMASLAVAVTTLTSPISRRAADVLVAAVPALGEDAAAPDRAALTAWLCDLHPRRAGGVEPLRPDLLAEQLLAETAGQTLVDSWHAEGSVVDHLKDLTEGIMAVLAHTATGTGTGTAVLTPEEAEAAEDWMYDELRRSFHRDAVRSSVGRLVAEGTDAQGSGTGRTSWTGGQRSRPSARNSQAEVELALQKRVVQEKRARLRPEDPIRVRRLAQELHYLADLVFARDPSAAGTLYDEVLEKYGSGDEFTHDRADVQVNLARVRMRSDPAVALALANEAVAGYETLIPYNREAYLRKLTEARVLVMRAKVNEDLNGRPRSSSRRRSPGS
ncbi:hypothetical protein CcI49_25040 [Frankia sp. CcI49]|uniref:hypothetical protein n=1 Tax=Frankia sp. CcI49 TaxID=1745382 RepID=UPI0009761405|nr:hypothetical protein [Frankia sp. CcI49]ONH57729.1 hypothetical protein CcI49_25040 [Frankia sp. CcI49]